jgi:hypothetical protein
VEADTFYWQRLLTLLPRSRGWYRLRFAKRTRRGAWRYADPVSKAAYAFAAQQPGPCACVVDGGTALRLPVSLTAVGS